MIIKVNKKEFEKHLNNISKALNSNSPLHSLQGVKITATGNSIQLVASNGNLSIKEEINVSPSILVQEPGVILVPGKLFKEIIKKQDGDIEIKVVGESIEITSNDSKTNINLLNSSDYPNINFDSYGEELVISVNQLNQVIKDVSFAAAEADKRIILNGVNLSASSGVLKAAATNSYRLAYEQSEIDSDIEFDITIISKNLKDFIPVDAKGELIIAVNDSSIITKYKGTTIVSKLIDGMYPQVSKLIPKEFITTLKVGVRQIENLVSKAIVVSNEGNRVIQLSIDEKELIIESKRDEVGDTVVKTTDFKLEGNPIKIPFDSQFFKDAISKFKGEVVIRFAGPQKPFIIQSEAKPNLIQLVLPHRTY